MVKQHGGEKPMHRILVVDDEAIVLRMLGDTLRDQGYEIVTARDGVEALDQVNQHSFAVIISDQRMPRMTGLEFLANAKLVQPDASRILITAVLDLNTVIDAINSGDLFRFLVKPWLHEELLCTVKNAVQRYELVVSNKALQATTQAMNEQLQKINAAMEAQLRSCADHNLQLEHVNRALKENLQHSIELCVKTLETFYPALGSNARRVNALCSSMAAKLNLPADERQTLEVSAWLHDIGLLGVPRELIRRWHRRPDSLSEAERALIQQHPVWGQELAKFVDKLGFVGVVIRGHRERFDGLGYPDQLIGEQIPWLARLLAVAVAYCEEDDHQGKPGEKVVAGSGLAFDSEAVQTLLQCLPHSAVPRKEREVPLSELEPGMVLAKGIYDSNGLLLLFEGQKLTAAAINKLHAHRRISPVNQFVQVYC